MKTFFATLVLLATATCAFAEPLSTNEIERLCGTVIPEFTVRETPLDQVLDQLNYAWHEACPERILPVVVVTECTNANPNVSFRGRTCPVGDILKIIAEVASCKFSLVSDGVVVRTINNGTRVATAAERAEFLRNMGYPSEQEVSNLCSRLTQLLPKHGEKWEILTCLRPGSAPLLSISSPGTGRAASRLPSMIS